MQYPNALGRKIEIITIEGATYNPLISIDVTFSSGFFHTISVRMKAEESEMFQLTDKLDTILKGMRLWYAPAARRDIFETIDIIILLLFFAAFMSFFLTIPESNVFSKDEIEQFRSYVFSFLATAWPVIWVLNRIRGYIFPDAYFAIGQGQKRYDILEKIRWTVVIAPILGILSSIVAGLFLMKI